MIKFCCSGGGDFLYSRNPGRRTKLIIDLDGMVVPDYRSVARAQTRMLTLAWERRWDELMTRCEERPDEAFCKTEHSGRTALHLATFNSGCPLEVAVALLGANRHALIVEDKNCYTPLHNLGLFHGGDDLMSLFCDTAVMVEQELKGRGKLPTLSRTSPLYLAAKRDAPTSTLRLLLQTRARSQWIAPFTGGESYWDRQQNWGDCCSSPLEILLRGRASCFVGLSRETKRQMANMVLRNLGRDQAKEMSWVAEDPHDQKAITMWEKCLLFLEENVRTTATTTTTTVADSYCPSRDESQTDDATRHAPSITESVPSLLHTIASLKVPMPVLLQLAADLFPDQMLQRDETGKFPLYHILKSNHPYATKQLINILLQANNSAAPSRTNGTAICYELEYILECVLVALETGLTLQGGLQDIVMSNSDVLTVQDPETGLVPAYFAACKDAPVDTIFFLLVTEPRVLISSSSWRDLSV